MEMSLHKTLIQNLNDRTVRIGVIGLGYVGLPLILALYHARFRSIGFDIDIEKVEKLQSGESYIKAIKASEIQKILEKGFFEATQDFSRIQEVDYTCLLDSVPLVVDTRNALGGMHVPPACHMIKA